MALAHRYLPHLPGESQVDVPVSAWGTPPTPVKTTGKYGPTPVPQGFLRAAWFCWGNT